MCRNFLKGWNSPVSTLFFFCTLALSIPSGLWLFSLQHTECHPHTFSSVFFFQFDKLSPSTHHPPLALCPCAVMWLTARLPFSLIFLFLFFSLHFYLTIHQYFYLHSIFLSIPFSPIYSFLALHAENSKGKQVVDAYQFISQGTKNSWLALVWFADVLKHE